MLWGRFVPAWKKAKFARRCPLMPRVPAGPSRLAARRHGHGAGWSPADCWVKTALFQIGPEKNVAPGCSHPNAGVGPLTAWQTPRYLPRWRGRRIGGGCGVCWAGSWGGTCPWLSAGVGGQPTRVNLFFLGPRVLAVPDGSSPKLFCLVRCLWG